jgi:hypothetical protein
MTSFSRKFILSVVCGAGLTAFFVLLRFDMEDFIKCLCDGFSLSGVLMLCFGGVGFVRADGGFTSMEYLFYWVKNSLLPFGKSEKVSYGEFCEERGQVRLKRGFLPALAAGALYLLVAFLLLLVCGY